MVRIPNFLPYNSIKYLIDWYHLTYNTTFKSVQGNFYFFIRSMYESIVMHEGLVYFFKGHPSYIGGMK